MKIRIGQSAAGELHDSMEGRAGHIERVGHEEGAMILALRGKLLSASAHKSATLDLSVEETKELRMQVDEETMKIIGVRWFMEVGKPEAIGVVLVKMNKEEMMRFDHRTSTAAFIGTGSAKFSHSAVHDIDTIVKNGARFPVEAAKMLMK